MIGEEAFKELCKGKIIRRKDWGNKYLMMRDAYPTRYIVRYTFNEAPLINESLCETDFGMSIDLKCSSHDIWEEYIPFYDFLRYTGYYSYKGFIISEKERHIKELKEGCYDIDTAKRFFATYLSDILYHVVKRTPDKKVLDFIKNFSLSFGIETYDEVMYPLFTSGYCYYFANMLKSAFDVGTLCLCYPYGHIVYMKDYVPYDITGEYEGEEKLFIPIKYLDKEDLENFKHTSDKVNKKTKEYTESVANKYCNNFLKGLGFGGIFEDALEEMKEKK